jgi:hypothetical protein
MLPQGIRVVKKSRRAAETVETPRYVVLLETAIIDSIEAHRKGYSCISGMN